MFENQVLEIVKDILGDVEAEFFNGTLFVQCSKSDGRLLWDNLTADPVLMVDLNGIILSQFGTESAYDFV